MGFLKMTAAAPARSVDGCLFEPEFLRGGTTILVYKLKESFIFSYKPTKPCNLSKQEKTTVIMQEKSPYWAASPIDKAHSRSLIGITSLLLDLLHPLLRTFPGVCHPRQCQQSWPVKAVLWTFFWRKYFASDALQGMEGWIPCNIKIPQTGPSPLISVTWWKRNECSFWNTPAEMLDVTKMSGYSICPAGNIRRTGWRISATLQLLIKKYRVYAPQ